VEGGEKGEKTQPVDSLFVITLTRSTERKRRRKRKVRVDPLASISSNVNFPGRKRGKKGKKKRKVA